MKIIGIRPSSFTAREDESKQVSGKNIYVTYPLEKGEGHGSECCPFFPAIVFSLRISSRPRLQAVGGPIVTHRRKLRPEARR